MTTLHIELPPEVLEAIATRAADLVLQQLQASESERADGPDEWMTTAEAAAYRRLTPAALRARVRRGTVTAYDDNGRWLFRRSELDAELGATMTSGRHHNGRAPRQRPRPDTEGVAFDA